MWLLLSAESTQRLSASIKSYAIALEPNFQLTHLTTTTTTGAKAEASGNMMVEKCLVLDLKTISDNVWFFFFFCFQWKSVTEEI